MEHFTRLGPKNFQSSTSSSSKDVNNTGRNLDVKIGYTILGAPSSR
jgi:hypothetical protein